MTGARVTIKDVARVADVSPMTASRVVNGRGNVNEDARQRVLAAVKTLGYIRNSPAGALRSRATASWTIGLILNDVGNSFSADLHRAVEDVARARGSLVLTASTDDSHEHMEHLVNEFWSRQVDGIVLAPPPGDQHYLEASIARDARIVLVDRPAVGVPLPTVMSDGHAGARSAVEHLTTHGHRSIAYLGDVRSPAMRLRFDGYVAGMLAADLDVTPTLALAGIETFDDARRAVVALHDLAEPPTAIITGRNRTTLGAVRALRELEMQHRTALIGFDDLDLAPDLDPGLTVVSQDPRRIGTLAAETLFAELDGNAAATRSLILPTTLIPRGSGEIPGPGRD